MLTFTVEFIAVSKYFLPGILAAVPYWITWQVKRTASDYFWITFLMTLLVRGVEIVADLTLRFMFGPSLKASLAGLGQMAPHVGEIALCITAIGIGFAMGWRGRKQEGDDAELHVPFEPFPCR